MPPDQLTISVLVSIGLHPKSGRDRRADQDARALEMSMRLSDSQLNLIHAGENNDTALRDYLGMGVSQLTLLEQSADSDVVDSLVHHLAQSSTNIVLTGVRSEQGEGSGMLPYLLGEKLGWPVVSRIAEITKIEDGKADVLQALPRGQRRRIEIELPFVASVDNAAAAPRQIAFGPAMRASIDIQPVTNNIDDERLSWQQVPARKRPKRLKIIKAKTAADRFKAATAKAQSSGGKILKNESVDEKAQVLFDFLLSEGVINPKPNR